ncbi:MAG: hypothetical protein J5736_02595, partial [Bacilli bacterium]|nr:hypothetical protein [Bacilli bacterium]
VSGMISVMEFLAGFIVIICLCQPLNKYRILTIIGVFFGALLLAVAIPRWYVGGQAISLSDIFSGKLSHEFFQPWNAVIIQNMFQSPAVWITFGAFVLIGSPLFYFLHRFIDIKLNRRLEVEYHREMEEREKNRKR